MSLTKEEVSDLKSLQQELVRSTLLLQIAEYEKKAAEQKLAIFLHQQEFPPKA